MEEKEYNDIESLAAYLHSDKFKERNKPETVKPADNTGLQAKKPVPVKNNKESIDDFLFSIENKRKKQASSPSSSPSKASVPTRTPTEKAVRESSAPVKASGKPSVKTNEGKIAPEAAAAAAARPAEKTRVRNTEEKASEKKEIISLAESLGAKKPSPEKPQPAAEKPSPSPDKTQLITMEKREEPNMAAVKEELPEEPDYDDEELTDEFGEGDNSATRMMTPVGRDTTPITENNDYDEDDPTARAERRRLVELRRKYEKQKQRVRTFAYLLLSVFLAIVIVGASAYCSTYIIRWAQDLTGIATTEFKLDVVIPENADIDTVAAILSENNIISSPRFFSFFAKLTDKDEGFIPGSYTLSSNMAYSTLLSSMRTEKNEIRTVTLRIVEGMTAMEIGELLEENNVCFKEDFEKYYKNVQGKYDFERRVKESPYKFNQLEGYLFPDTYEFYVTKGMAEGCHATNDMTLEEAEEQMKLDSLDNAEDAAIKMFSNFNDKITPQMYKKMGEMNMTLDEIIALASMVQKEAASVEDMQSVASVFLNRIRSSAEFPNLQSDVTVLYVENNIKPFIKGSASEKSKIYDAYNTYVCEGTPPGAVCNPGLDAIEAVLANIPSEYYYFCANEETGEIFYAKTHAEHEENLKLAGLTAGSQEGDYIE